MNSTTPPATSKSEVLSARYGDTARPPAGPWNDHLSLMLSHRSVRGYKPDALPTGTLETLIAAAQSAASSSNLQVWSVVSITDPAVKAELTEIAGDQQHINQCPLFLVWLADLSRNQRLGAEEGVDMEVMPYLETFLVAAVDAALAAQNAVIAAESLGLSTVYIGAMRNNPKRVAELLGLPSGAMAVFGLCVGYAAADAANEVKPRLPQPAVRYHGTYGNPDEQALRAAYDAEVAAFSDRHAMPHDTWSKRVMIRMGKLASMNGRETLKEVVQALGFPLR
jgi:nitroreductase